MIPPFILTNPRLALYALCAVAASGFGQTFFVSVMGEELRQAFALSHTAYGSLYSGATLLSALLLLRLGSLADTWSLPRVTSLAVLALAVGCLCMILLGITQGFASTAAGAVWAERYGVLHLGAIRSLVQAIMVVSTAIAPVLFGFLLDLHISLPALSAATATGIFGAACLALLAANPK